MAALPPLPLPLPLPPLPLPLLPLPLPPPARCSSVGECSSYGGVSGSSPPRSQGSGRPAPFAAASAPRRRHASSMLRVPSRFTAWQRSKSSSPSPDMMLAR